MWDKHVNEELYLKIEKSCKFPNSLLMVKKVDPVRSVTCVDCFSNEQEKEANCKRKRISLLFFLYQNRSMYAWWNMFKDAY